MTQPPVLPESRRIPGTSWANSRLIHRSKQPFHSIISSRGRAASAARWGRAFWPSGGWWPTRFWLADVLPLTTPVPW